MRNPTSARSTITSVLLVLWRDVKRTMYDVKKLQDGRGMLSVQVRTILNNTVGDPGINEQPNPEYRRGMVQIFALMMLATRTPIRTSILVPFLLSPLAREARQHAPSQPNQEKNQYSKNILASRLACVRLLDT
eukprot:scaffold181953_cov35-Tisochrysis_lutea.AAC.1